MMYHLVSALIPLKFGVSPLSYYYMYSLFVIGTSFHVVQFYQSPALS